MNKKTRLKIGIVAVIVVITCFCGLSFAEEPTTPTSTNSSFGTIARILHFLVCILSWIWIIFAKLAGELLTNKWVYGEILGLDSILWQYRNVVKNIANYCLGFYFVYTVFSAIFKKDDISKKVKDVLLWMVVAGIGIQVSWFFTAVVVDVSTVTIAAAGAFPSQVISDYAGFDGEIRKTMVDKFQGPPVMTGIQYVLFPNNSRANSFVDQVPITFATGMTAEQMVDAIMPSTDDVGGPLYYMGVSIIDAFSINSIAASSEDAYKMTILDVIIQGGATIVYSIEMGVLCILALMRILYLWMFIVLSPIVVLLRCIQNSGTKLGGEGLFSFISGFTKQVNFKSFFINVFKPTLIVLGISVTVMLVTLIKATIKSTTVISNVDLGGVRVISQKMNGATTNSDSKYSTSIISDSGLLTYTIEHVGKGILDFILSVITVILVYFIIKIAMTMGGGTDFVSQKIGSLQKSIGSTMKSLPIVPVTGYDEKGVPTTKFIGVGAALSLGTRKIDSIRDEFKLKSSRDQDKILKAWGLEDEKGISITNQTAIRQANGKIGWQKLIEQRSIIDGIKTSEGRGMKLDPRSTNKFWIGEFEKWLTEMKGRESEIRGEDAQIWSNMVSWWNEGDNSKKGLEAMFKGNRSGETASVRAYARFFNLGNITTWAQLIQKDISSENDTKGETEPAQEQSSSGGGTTGTGSGGTTGGSGGTGGTGGSGGGTSS